MSITSLFRTARQMTSTQQDHFHRALAPWLGLLLGGIALLQVACTTQQRQLKRAAQASQQAEPQAKTPAPTHQSNETFQTSPKDNAKGLWIRGIWLALPKTKAPKQKQKAPSTTISQHKTEAQRRAERRRRLQRALIRATVINLLGAKPHKPLNLLQSPSKYNKALDDALRKSRGLPLKKPGPGDKRNPPSTR